MRLHEEVVTRATPERVWELIADPENHGRWNPHVVGTERISCGEPAFGARYRVTYELSGRRSEFDAVVVEFSPPKRWAARLEERTQGDGRNFGRYMTETYTVVPHGNRVHVAHDVEIVLAGVPLWLRALVWFIQKLGRPTEPTIMQRFGELAESDSPKGRSAA
jgi:uncharacterized protein YndB with AHSA1/START domain